MSQRPQIALTVALLAAWCSSRPAFAGMPNGACSHPVIFPNAAVNVVVLSYTDETGRLPEASFRLSLLLQQQLLAMIAPYGRVGSVRLLGSDDECRADAVHAKLKSSGMLSDGHSVVYVYGRFFEDGDDLRVQSFVRFERDGGLPEFRLDVQGVAFRTPLPTRPVAFTPRGLSRAALDRLSEQFRQSARVYQSPTESSTSRPLPVSPTDREASYFVIDQRGEWMQVEGRFGRGWLKAGAMNDASALVAQLPEVLFVKSMVGFLQAFAGGSRVPAARALDDAAATAIRFAAAIGTGADEQALGWGAIVSTFAALARDEASPAAVTTARAAADRAVRAMPYEPSVRVMRAALSLQLAQQSAGVQPWRDAKKDLLAATVLDQHDTMATQNLAGLQALSLPASWSRTDQLVALQEQQSVAAVLGFAPDPADVASPSAPSAPDPGIVAAVPSAGGPGRSPLQVQLRGGFAYCCDRGRAVAGLDVATVRGPLLISVGAHALLGDGQILLLPLGVSYQAGIGDTLGLSITAGAYLGYARVWQEGVAQNAAFVAPEVSLKLALAHSVFVALPITTPVLFGFKKGVASIFEGQLATGVRF